MLILSDTIRKIEILFYKEESIMRGVETRIQEIRHKIFTEVARMAYHTEWPVKEIVLIVLGIIGTSDGSIIP